MKVSELKKLINSKNYQKRIKGYSLLDDFPKATIRKYLITGINDRHYQVRGEIANYMGQAKDSSFIPHLISLLNDKSSLVRFKAASSLGYYQKHKNSIEDHLIHCLNDKNSTVRLCAVESLGDIESINALPYLKKQADKDEHDLVRGFAVDSIRYIIYSLSNISEIDIYKKWLLKKVQNEEPFVKIQIVIALIHLSSSDYLSQIITLVNHIDPSVRNAIINRSEKIIPFISSKKIIEILKSRLSKEKNMRCKKSLKQRIANLENDNN